MVILLRSTLLEPLLPQFSAPEYELGALRGRTTSQQGLAGDASHKYLS